MYMGKRMPLPKKIENEILFRNRNVCCICRKSNIQIHHIDGNSSNNKLSNLCVLCIEHHAQASAKGLMTKGLNSSLLRKYKNDWENFIFRERKIVVPKTTNLREIEHIKFEIKKIIYNFPNLKTKEEVDKSLNSLYHWHLLEGYTKYIIESFDRIHWFLTDRQIDYIAQKLYEFFWQYDADPKDLPITKKAEKEILLAVEFLYDLIFQLSVISDRPAKPLQSICESLKTFSNTAASHKNAKLQEGILKFLKKAEREWTKNYQKKNIRNGTGIKILKRTIYNLERELN